MAAGTTVTFPFRADGYVSATQMAKVTGKRYNKWRQSDAAQNYINVMQQELGLPELRLITGRRGGDPNRVDHGTWLHPTMATHFARWCSPTCAVTTSASGLSITFPRTSTQSRCPEKAISDALAIKVGGRREVPTPCGPADVVTADTVIEVKNSIAWKQAIGQALVYASELNLKPHVHLFVQEKDRHRFMQSFAQIKKHMAALNIEFTFEHVA